MKITIITSTYNCGKSILETARSIEKQNYKIIEWIVVDGKSTDDTIIHLNSIKKMITDLTSEKDLGVYDAWNKGCDRITGDYVLFLGAGDTLYNEKVLENFVKFVSSNKKYLIYCGNVSLVDEYSIPIVDLLSLNCNVAGNFIKTPPHPGTFTDASLLKQKRPFDSSYKIAADQKFMIPLINQRKAIMFDLYVSRMDSTGISNNYKNLFIIEGEMNRVKKELGYTLTFIQIALGYFKAMLRYLVNMVFAKNHIRTAKKLIKI